MSKPATLAAPLPIPLQLVAALDIAWSALGLVVTGFGLLAGATTLAFGLIAPETLEHAWTHLDLGARAMTIGACVEIASGPIFNAFLLAGAIALLRRRRSAERCLRVWAVGAVALSLLDLAVLIATWVPGWSWIALPFLLATPAWAAVNVVAVRRYVRTAS